MYFIFKRFFWFVGLRCIIIPIYTVFITVMILSSINGTVMFIYMIFLSNTFRCTNFIFTFILSTIWFGKIIFLN
uniref:Uncharacterized protein n=1 Tax=Panstrongylus lignarius TaxID=156445 RepID=A0A224XXB2_9HEMI